MLLVAFRFKMEHTVQVIFVLILGITVSTLASPISEDHDDNLEQFPKAKVPTNILIPNMCLFVRNYFEAPEFFLFIRDLLRPVRAQVRILS